MTTQLKARVELLRQGPEFSPVHAGAMMNLHAVADDIQAAADEIVRLRAEVAVLTDSAAKLYDIAASGAEPPQRRRMLDQMAMQSFAENG